MPSINVFQINVLNQLRAFIKDDKVENLDDGSIELEVSDKAVSLILVIAAKDVYWKMTNTIVTIEQYLLMTKIMSRLYGHIIQDIQRDSAIRGGWQGISSDLCCDECKRQDNGKCNICS